MTTVPFVSSHAVSDGDEGVRPFGLRVRHDIGSVGSGVPYMIPRRCHLYISLNARRRGGAILYLTRLRARVRYYILGGAGKWSKTGEAHLAKPLRIRVTANDPPFVVPTCVRQSRPHSWSLLESTCSHAVAALPNHEVLIRTSSLNRATKSFFQSRRHVQMKSHVEVT